MITTFNFLNSEQHYFKIANDWEKTHSIGILYYVGEILESHHSLWQTSYGKLYQVMCHYFGYSVPRIPPRQHGSNYIIIDI